MKRDAFSCYDGCRVVMPNGHLFWFNVDVQWVLGGPAEWLSPFSIVQCLMFKGSRVVSRMAIFFFVQCLMFNRCRAVMTEWPSFFLLFNVDAESVSSIVTLLVICPILTCVYFT